MESSIESNRAARVVNLILGLALVLFIVGVTAPIITIEKFVLITNEFSLLSGIAQLVLDGRLLLALIVFLFTIVTPLVKITLLYRYWNGRQARRRRLAKSLHRIARYGKWSMLDVFVVAVVVASVKISIFANVAVHFGLYAFAASVLLTMLATSMVTRRSAEEVDQASGSQSTTSSLGSTLQGESSPGLEQ